MPGVRVCALPDKSSARLVPVTIDYVGFHWQVGYGIDSESLERNLRDIYASSAKAS